MLTFGWQNLLEKEIATQKKIIESTKETYRVQEKTIAELYSRVEVERYRTEHVGFCIYHLSMFCLIDLITVEERI